MGKPVPSDKRMNQDILFFTMHRSGSMFVFQFCAQLCSLADIPYYSPNLEHNIIPQQPEPEFWYNKHGCFGPLRRYMEIPHMEDYQVILHLRDPRDVLVSMFYSFCYSHNGPIEPNTGIRKEVADRGIDNFVLMMSTGTPPISGYGTGPTEIAGNVLQRYETYLERLVGKPNVIFVTYEEMVNSFQSWMEKMIVPFGLPPNPRIDTAQTRELFSVSQENAHRHKRKIMPGDYKEKLAPGTIAQLNHRFHHVLTALKYSI